MFTIIAFMTAIIVESDYLEARLALPLSF
jgi:hypothetical protein